MLIDLISDTVTKPSQGMLEFMISAEVGDDVFKQDPTVNMLQEMVAEMFGKEAALFCPSGTMTNQIALKTHTNPLDEVICDIDSHIFQYETGGYAFNSGVAIQPLKGELGKINHLQIEQAIKPKYDWLAETKLVVLENSCNKGGGSFYSLGDIIPIHELCKRKNLRLHLDGARLFNVLVETDEKPKDVGGLFDSISICISKGLGAPVGSLLIGEQKFIAQARRYRKVMGGGMRQAGFLAAACLYALENNIERLKEDNDRAKQLGNFLRTLPYVLEVIPVMTNIVIFTLNEEINSDDFIHHLEENHVTAAPFGPNTIRFVTHLGINEEMINRVKSILDNYSNSS